MQFPILIILNKKNFIEIFKKECVLIVAVLLAIITSFFYLPKLEYIDFKVLVLLFNLMIVVAAFRKLKVLDSIALIILKRCKSFKGITFALVFITFFFSMIVTNDVALLTFVPLTIIISRKTNISSIKTVVFQTLAANIGSSLTPMGNPHNLFIYSFYNIAPSEFIKITLPFVLLGSIFLIGIILIEKDKKIEVDLKNVKIEEKIRVIIYTCLFFMIILSVLHVVDYKIAFIITILIVFILNRELFFKVDYSLLITFIGFFIFIGNISSMSSIKNFMNFALSGECGTYFSAIILSQGISNVPTAILLAGFTTHFKELLLGVNIGGMGTLISSLASLIAYKIYSREFIEDNNKYLRIFTKYNIIALILFTIIFYITNFLMFSI